MQWHVVCMCSMCSMHAGDEDLDEEGVCRRRECVVACSMHVCTGALALRAAVGAMQYVASSGQRDRAGDEDLQGVLLGSRARGRGDVLRVAAGKMAEDEGTLSGEVVGRERTPVLLVAEEHVVLERICPPRHEVGRAFAVGLPTHLQDSAAHLTAGDFSLRLHELLARRTKHVAASSRRAFTDAP